MRPCLLMLSHPTLFPPPSFLTCPPTPLLPCTLLLLPATLIRRHTNARHSRHSRVPVFANSSCSPLPLPSFLLLPHDSVKCAIKAVKISAVTSAGSLLSSFTVCAAPRCNPTQHTSAESREHTSVYIYMHRLQQSSLRQVSSTQPEKLPAAAAAAAAAASEHAKNPSMSQASEGHILHENTS